MKRSFKIFLVNLLALSIFSLFFSIPYELIDAPVVETVSTIMSIYYIIVLIWAIVWFIKILRQKNNKYITLCLLFYILYSIIINIVAVMMDVKGVDMKGFDSPGNAIIVIIQMIWDLVVVFIGIKLIIRKVSIVELSKNVQIKKSKDLSGVGGWLSIFIFSLFGGAFYTIYSGFSDVIYLSNNLLITGFGKTLILTFDVLFFSLMLVLFIYTIYSLLKKNNNAIFLAKSLLSAVFISNAVVIIINLFNFSLGSSFDKTSVVFIRSLVYSIVWFLYLVSSKRVRLTFPTHLRRASLFDKIFCIFSISLGLIMPLTGFVLGFKSVADDQESQEFAIKWQQFNSVENNFSINFPRPPYHSFDVVNYPDFARLLELESYMSSFYDDIEFAVYVVQFPPDLGYGKPELDLQAVLNANLNMDNDISLVSSDFGEFKNYPAMDYLLYDKENLAYMRGKCIMVDKKIFQLMMIYDDGDFDDSSYDMFIDSFRPDIKQEQIPTEIGDNLSLRY